MAQRQVADWKYVDAHRQYMEDDDASLKSVADELGVSHVTVWKHWKRLGLNGKPVGQARTFDHEQAYDMYLEGESTAALAEAFGVSEKRMKDVIREVGEKRYSRASGRPGSVRTWPAAIRQAHSVVSVDGYTVWVEFGRSMEIAERRARRWAFERGIQC